MVIKTAAGRQEGDKGCLSWWRQDAKYLFYLSASSLTNNSSGGVDDVARGLSRDLSARAEEQLGGEGLSERPLLGLHAVLVTTVPSAHGHLLPFHQLHQLLRLAGRTQGAWLVPVEGGEVCQTSFPTK